MNNLVVAGLLATTIPAFSNEAYQALAPEYQRQREIETIISSEEFLEQQALYNDPSAHIDLNPKGYMIETEHYTMQVNVVYEPTGRIGPVQYHLEFDKPIAKN